MENTDNPKSSSTVKVMIAAAVLLVVFGVAFVLVLRSYTKEDESRAAVVSDAEAKDPDYVEVSVKIVSVDPIKGDAVARIEFEPHGSLTTDEGVTVARDLKLYVNSANGKQEHDFSKGKRMNPIETVVDMYDGQVMDYPFDSHKAQLTLAFIAPAPKENKQAGAATRAEDDSAGAPAEEPGDEAVPVTVELYGSVAGLKMEAKKSSDSTPEFVTIDLDISRASTARFFSLFIMTAMWALTVAVLLLTLFVAFGNRKIELAMFSFLGALLFAFPALRNSQPGTPPIGTLGDFIAFFWAEVIIALCLLALLALWLYRKPAK
jgi:hypothetical protein